MDIQTILSQLKQLTTNLETVSAQISDNKPNPQVSSSDSLLLNRTSSASNLPNADNQTSDVLTLKNQILRLQTELNDLSKERDMWRDKYKELSGQGCISDSDTLTKSTLLPLTVTKSKSTTSKSTFSLLISNENQCFQTTYGTVIQTSHFSKTSVLLSWNQPPKTCLIIKKENDTLSESFLFQITRYLHQHNITVYVEPSVYQVIKDKTPVVTWPACKSVSFSSIIDFVITLGGDGTLLHLNTIFKKSVPPIVSFALGTLGFLTPFDIHHYETVLNTVLTSDLPLTLRTRLNCCFDDSNTSYTVLNDIVLDRGENCSMVNLECYIGDKHITTVHADGLIIATPTGSTAYSMAAGGSMVHPSVPAMLLTPICPHTLSFRQMILPDNVTLRVEVSMDSRTNVRVSFDGRHQHTLMKGQSISISVSIHPLPSVSPTATSNDWYTNVNESLNWNKQLCRKNQIFLQKQSTEI